MSNVAYVSNNGNDYQAFAPQDTPGTPGTTFTFMRWLSGGIAHDRATTVEREGGSGQDMTLAYVEHHTANSAGEMYGRPDTFTKVLAWALGQSSVVATVTGGRYGHEIWPTDDPRILTYEEYAPDGQLGHQVIDGVISGVTIEGEHGKPVKVSFDYTGGDSPRERVVGSARTVTLESIEPWYFNQASHAVSLNGGPVANDDVTKWTVTFTREVDDAVFGVGYGRKVVPGLNRNVTVDWTQRFVSPSMHKAINYGAGSVVNQGVASGAFKVFMTNGLTGASLRSLELEIPLMVAQTISRNTFEPDGQTVYEDLTGVAIKGATHLIRARAEVAIATHIASGIS